MLARLSSEGKIAIPGEIRKSLGLEQGTEFHVKVEAGRIILQPIDPSAADKLYGLFADFDLLTQLENKHRQELRDDVGLVAGDPELLRLEGPVRIEMPSRDRPSS